MNFAKTIHDLWAARARCYTALIWWISMRYFSIGWEYIFQTAPSSPYVLMFADVTPPLVGAWMVLVGSVGISSQIFQWRKRIINVPMITCFAIGVCIHSLFRISVLWQSNLVGDPLMVLFVCDFSAMAFIFLGLPYGRKILSC